MKNENRIKIEAIQLKTQNYRQYQYTYDTHNYCGT